jgi:DNA-binding transcriptional LysR family regulator
MDIELARTFLKVIDTGNFVGAADHLHITQAAVSRRIKALEGYLGCALFVRNKAGAVLTPAGKRFQKHAAKLVMALEQARHDVGVAPPYRASLTVGGRFGLWDGLLLQWLALMRERAPDVILRAQIGFEEGLIQQLVDGSIDIGVMYTPQRRPGLMIEPLLEEELILVTSDADHGTPSRDYVYVEWGPEFHDHHSLNLPEFTNPGLIVGIGWLGLGHLLQSGGSGYFPERLVRPHLHAGTLHQVPDASTFKLPAYVVYPADRDEKLLDPAITAMHRVSRGVTRP